MLADDQNAIDCELWSATSQGFGDGRVNLEAEALRTLGALVTLGLLVHVKRHDVHLGPVPFPLVGIAHQKPVSHVLRVRQVTPDGRDNRQLLARWGSLPLACLGFVASRGESHEPSSA